MSGLNTVPKFLLRLCQSRYSASVLALEDTEDLIELEDKILNKHIQLVYCDFLSKIEKIHHLQILAQNCGLVVWGRVRGEATKALPVTNT